MKRFNSIEDIERYYDDVCHRYGRPKAKISIRNYGNEEWLGICHAVTPYWIEFTNMLFHLEWDNLRDEYRKNEGLVDASDYIIYHEIFHHLSGLMDGENFEHQLHLFIKDELLTNVKFPPLT